MNIEVELRALIDDERALTALLKERDRLKVETVRQNRFLIDYSTYLEGVSQRTRDIRARVTNGRREIIVKVGALGATSRLESSVMVEVTTKELLTTMGLMGYTKGVAALRVIERFTIDDIEYAIQQVRKYEAPEVVFKTFVEAEIMADASSREAAEQRIATALAHFGLQPIAEEQWYEYIEMLNREANGVFDFEQPNWELVEKLGL